MEVLDLALRQGVRFLAWASLGIRLHGELLRIFKTASDRAADSVFT